MISIAVLTIQTLLYVIVPGIGFLGRRLSAEYVLASLIVGCSVQGILGTFWNAGQWGMNWLELIFFVSICLVLAFSLRAHPAVLQQQGISKQSFTLPFILLLAWIVRTIHPLQTWALGQSDAYSHLDFVLDVLSFGAISNPVYPPAYAWVMALPSFFFSDGPYWVARFGGAFFGMGLVLGIFALTRRLATAAAALPAAALVAGVPVFFLLQKTSVGSFANGLGLFFIPAVLWAYWIWREQGYAWRGLSMPVLAMAGLAFSVPMMFIHCMVLLAFFHVLLGMTTVDRTVWLQGTYRLAGIAFMVSLITLAFVMRVPSDILHVTAGMIVGQDTSLSMLQSSRAASLTLLIEDYLSVKRWGYGHWGVNLAAIGTSLCFLFTLVHGLKQRSPAWLLSGIWGCLTSVNVHLGIMQFTSYQREGWSLLLAAALWCGLIFSVCWQWLDGRIWRKALTALLVGASVAGLIFPPGHRPISSPAESEMVRLLLALQGSEPARRSWDSMASLWRITDVQGFVVLARPMAGFSNGQGDLVKTLSLAAFDSMGQAAETGKPIVFLRDKEGASLGLSTAMRLLQPHLIAQVEAYHAAMESANKALEHQLRDKSGFILVTWDVSPQLEVWLLQRQESEGSHFH